MYMCVCIYPVCNHETMALKHTSTSILCSNCQSRTVSRTEFKTLLWRPLHSSTPHYLINTDVPLTINKGKIRHREKGRREDTTPLPQYLHHSAHVDLPSNSTQHHHQGLFLHPWQQLWHFCIVNSKFSIYKLRLSVCSYLK